MLYSGLGFEDVNLVEVLGQAVEGREEKLALVYLVFLDRFTMPANLP